MELDDFEEANEIHGDTQGSENNSANKDEYQDLTITGSCGKSIYFPLSFSISFF